MTPPCYKCEKRRCGCHAECKEYGEWAAEREHQRQKEHAGTPYTEGYMRTRSHYMRYVIKKRSGICNKGVKNRS